MRTLIVGAGVVGSNLAAELSDSGHNVSIVDRRSQRIRHLTDRLDVLAVQGDGGQPSVLRRAGIESAEMVIAVTDVDEVNLVICMIAKHYGVKHKIARVRNDEFLGPDSPIALAAVGVDTAIDPESFITANLLDVLDIPGSIDVTRLAGGQVLLVTFDIDEGAPVAGKRLAELRDVARGRFLVVAIFRDERAIVPRGDDEIRVDDHIAVLVAKDALEHVLPLVQASVEAPARVVLYGASLVAERLARALQRKIDRVVLIEPNAEKAERAAEQLDHTVVIHGEASDPELLQEADILHCDFFFALSRDDQANLLAALMARRERARKIGMLSQDPHYVPVLSNIGMDVVVNPRLVAVSEILRYIRRGQVHMVTRLKESEAEVIELEALRGSKITRKPLSQIEFPAGSIIGAVLRDERMLIPDGSCQIAAGETVVVFALPPAIPKIEKLFSARGIL